MRGVCFFQILCERQRRPSGLVQALLIYEQMDGLNTIGTGKMGRVNQSSIALSSQD